MLSDGEKTLLGSRRKENSPCREQAEERQRKQRVQIALAPHRTPFEAGCKERSIGRGQAGQLSEGQPATQVRAGGDGHAALGVSPARGAAHAVPGPPWRRLRAPAHEARARGSSSPRSPAGTARAPRPERVPTGSPEPRRGVYRAGFRAQLGFPCRNARRHRAFRWPVSLAQRHVL